MNKIPYALADYIFYYQAERTYNSTYGTRRQQFARHFASRKTKDGILGIRSYGRSGSGKSAVENRRFCNDAWVPCHEKLNRCTVRNYSCKLAVCTRGKQARARSRNSWNLIYIKLRFYVRLVFKPYASLHRLVSYYIAVGYSSCSY